MILELNFLYKLSATDVALEPVMSGVSVHVMVQVTLLVKSLVANLTDVGSVVDVRTLVDGHRFFLPGKSIKKIGFVENRFKPKIPPTKLNFRRN